MNSPASIEQQKFLANIVANLPAEKSVFGRMKTKLVARFNTYAAVLLAQFFTSASSCLSQMVNWHFSQRAKRKLGSRNVSSSSKWEKTNGRSCLLMMSEFGTRNGGNILASSSIQIWQPEKQQI